MPRIDAGKVVETAVEIAAPVGSVWKAISEGRELQRWFPLEARITPGEGGEVFLSWGAPWEGSSRIDAWEPERRLRTRGFLEHGDASVVEYTLEARGGKTVLRLVQSGFAQGGDWEDELFAGTVRGWRYELRSLRHYVERHFGRDRVAVWPRARVRTTAAETWRRLLGLDGFVHEGRVAGLGEGEHYRATAATGDVFEGTVVVNDPPYEFAGTVAGLNDALVSLRTHEAGGPQPSDGHEAGLFLSTWGVPRPDVEALGHRWKRLLDRLATKES